MASSSYGSIPPSATDSPYSKPVPDTGDQNRSLGMFTKTAAETTQSDQEDTSLSGHSSPRQATNTGGGNQEFVSGSDRLSQQVPRNNEESNQEPASNVNGTDELETGRDRLNPRGNREVNPPVPGQGQQKEERTCTKRCCIIFSLIIAIFVALSLGGIVVCAAALSGDWCAGDSRTVYDGEQLVTENTTVKLILEQGHTTITAIDPGEVQHTVDLYLVKCQDIDSGTVIISFNRTIYLIEGECTGLRTEPIYVYARTNSSLHISINAENQTILVNLTIYLYDNLTEEQQFEDTCNTNEAIYSNHTSEISYTTHSDGYILPAVESNIAQHVEYLYEIMLLTYVIPEPWKPTCTLDVSNNKCDMDVGADMCVFAFTRVESQQNIHLYLKIHQTEQEEEEASCKPLVIVAMVVLALVFIAFIVAIVAIVVLCYCWRHCSENCRGSCVRCCWPCCCDRRGCYKLLPQAPS